MPAVAIHLLLKTLQMEGPVSVYWEKRSGCYHVFFRHAGKQYNRKTFKITKLEATQRGAEIVAEVIRGPKETDLVASLKAELTSLKGLMIQQMGNGAGGHVNRSNPHIKFELKTLEEARTAFKLARKSMKVSASNEARLERRIDNFVEFIGQTTALSELTVDTFAKWLETSGPNPRNRKNNHTAVAQFIRWCGSPPRRWCDPELTKGVAIPRIPRVSRLPEIILPEQAEALMSLLEEKHPEYVLYYAIALFGGARANKKDTVDDLDGGEIIRLFEAVRQDGWGKYYNGIVLRIPSGKVNGAPRQIYTPDGLKAWLEAYADSLDVPQRAWHTRNISSVLKLPPNGLRHTAASVFISLSGSDFGRAAVLFQSAEPTLKSHYVNLMTHEQALRYDKIRPKKRTALNKV